MPPDTHSRRLACLDGLRGVLALFVVVVHLGKWGGPPVWSRPAFASLGDGGLAVDAFFMLSGLVISRSVASFRSSPPAFVLARAARLYPPYLVALAAAVVLMPPALDNPRLGTDLLVHLAMAQGVFPQGMLPDEHLSILFVAWSLSTEWQFYLLVALLMTLRRDGAAVVASVLAALAVTGLWLGRGFSISFLPSQAHMFAFGVVTGVLMRPHRRGEAVACLLTVLACFAVMVSRQAWPKFLPLAAWCLTVAAQSLPERPLLAPVRLALQNRATQWLGRISYSLYLVHMPVLYAVWHLAPSNPVPRIATGLVASLAVGWALQRTVEAPAASRGHRMGRRLAARAQERRALGRGAPPRGAAFRTPDGAGICGSDRPRTRPDA